MSDYTNKPKLVAITQPGDYTVRIRKIRDEDCTATQKGDPKIKVLMTTQDGQKINDTFYGSTDGAIKRAFAFVATATQEKGLKLPGKTTEELRGFLSLAEGKCIMSQWCRKMSPSAPVNNAQSARSANSTASKRKPQTSN
jgi:hypothetical protein